MKTLPIIYQSKNKEELIKQILESHKSIADFYESIPDEIFTKPAIPDGWSVQENMNHVISTNNTFGIWFILPRFILKLRGKPKAKQPSVEQLDPTNRHGITDYGKYEKSKVSHLKQKEKLIQLIFHSVDKLISRINKRSEEELDSLSGPFGKMSLRTFAHFLIKHNLHHTNVVRLRLEE